MRRGLPGSRACAMAGTLAFTALAFFLAAPAAAASNPERASVSFDLAGAVDDVFPLFAPVNRSRWDAGWEIVITTPTQTGVGTEFHRVADAGTVWRVTALDFARHRIEMHYEKPGFHVMSVGIACVEGVPGTTTVAVDYAAEAANERIRESLRGRLQHQIQDLVAGPEGWKAKLDHYLASGKRLEPFMPVAIERRQEITLAADPDRVFELMNPAGGNHWTAVTPDYVFGSAEAPDGAMWRASDAWYGVVGYAAAARTMKTVLFIPEVEFLIEEARCAPGPGGGTTLTVTWRVAGLSEAGNEAVQGFFDTYWDRRMASIEAVYSAQIEATAD